MEEAEAHVKNPRPNVAEFPFRHIHRSGDDQGTPGTRGRKTTTSVAASAGNTVGETPIDRAEAGNYHPTPGTSKGIYKPVHKLCLEKYGGYCLPKSVHKFFARNLSRNQLFAKFPHLMKK